jgi:hypothetical protein
MQKCPAGFENAQEKIYISALLDIYSLFKERSA